MGHNCYFPFDQRIFTAVVHLCRNYYNFNGGSKGALGIRAPLSPISFIFMKILANILPSNRLAHSLWQNLDLPLNLFKFSCCSAIRHLIKVRKNLGGGATFFAITCSMLQIEFHYSNSAYVSINVTNYFGSISWKLFPEKIPLWSTQVLSQKAFLAP